jgi:hypothetical protein
MLGTEIFDELFREIGIAMLVVFAAGLVIGVGVGWWLF